MRIYIGCDENGVELKKTLMLEMDSIKQEFIDYNVVYGNESDLYPDMAVGLCKHILEDNDSRGILICGTGIGTCISANKVYGIRAAVCHDVYSTERSMKSNDVQIMCMGAQIIGSELAKKLLHIWIESEFVTGGRSVPKVERINYYDELYRKSKE